MNIKHIAISYLLTFILSVNTLSAHKEIISTSFILFTLQNNQITLERYPLDEITSEMAKLSTDIREGHTLYKIGLSKSMTNVSSLFFYPIDQRYLVITTKQDKQQLDLLLSWVPLITQHTKQLKKLETIEFFLKHLEHQNPWKTSLTAQFTIAKKPCSLSLLLDTPIQAACGIFISDYYFTYDKGIFSRTFNQCELETLGLLKTGKNEIKMKTVRQKMQHLAKQIASALSHYASAGISAGRSAIVTGLSYTITAWNKIKNYFVQHRTEKNTQKTLHKSFDAEAEFDQLLEEAMNSDLDFIPKEKPKEPGFAIKWLQKVGTTILLHYISLEQKIKNGWHWLWNPNNSQYLHK